MNVPASTAADPFLSASELADAIARREIGCVEALERVIARIDELDSRLNAVVVRDYDRAFARARKLDAAHAPLGPLHGVPMTVKESFDVAGLPTTFGLPERAQHVAAHSAVAVDRLEDAGAVIVGKTNVPRLLLDWQSFNAVYGVTNNPWDLGMSPGGSSGGAAAALAAGMSTLEIGSDIGGSIRVPAHMCGLFGHKPTWGLLPMIGHSLNGAVSATDISVIGPLARSAGDLERALDVLAGPDPRDTRLALTLPPARCTSIAGMRIAVWAEDPVSPTDPEITAALHELAAFLARRGGDVKFTRPPFDVAEAYTIYLQLLAAAISIRFTPAQLAEARSRVAAAPDDPDPDAVMDRAFEIPHREWVGLNERRHALRRVWQSFFDDFDVLLCPPFATAALAHDTVSVVRERRVTVAGRTIPYDGLGFWPGIVGAYHLPATVAPLGSTAAGLPIGVQIVGPQHGDRQTLAFAKLLEAQWRAFEAPPAYRAPARVQAHTDSR